MKARCHAARRPNLSFWRDSAGLEVDIVREAGGRLHPVEVKSGATFASDWLTGLAKWSALAGTDAAPGTVVYGGADSYAFQGTQIVAWRDLAEALPAY